jgi:hypothetical protein
MSISAELRAGVTTSVRADKPVGEWNPFHITLKEGRRTVRLNDQVVIEQSRLPGIPAKEPVGLQHHGDRSDGEWGASFVQFRRLDIREGPPNESED